LHFSTPQTPILLRETAPSKKKVSVLLAVIIQSRVQDILILRESWIMSGEAWGREIKEATTYREGHNHLK
jgi:hypothetical protein